MLEEFQATQCIDFSAQSSNLAILDFLSGLSVDSPSDWVFISMIIFDFDAEGEVVDFVVAFVAHDGDDVDSLFSLLNF